MANTERLKRFVTTVKGKALELNGEVSEITQSDSDDDATLVIRHGPKPKKDKDHFAVGRHPETTRLSVPNSFAKKFSIGQRVKITVSSAKND